MQKFREDFPSLSNDEYQQACYHYAGFSPKFISLLMHQKYPTIYKRRTRIKEKIMASDSAHKEELIANLKGAGESGTATTGYPASGGKQ